MRAVKILVHFIICTALALSLPILAQSEKIKFIGKAYDLTTNEFLYTELHEDQFENGQPQKGTVIYRRPDGEIIVKKEIDFTPGSALPSFYLEDFRDGYIEGAEWRDKTLYVKARRTKDNPLKEEKLSPNQPIVIDKGFDFFVRNSFDSLMADKTIQFDFIVPIEFNSFRFRIAKEQDTEFDQKKAVVFKLELNNSFIRWLSDPIYLTYDIKTKQLLRYQGTSNINDEQGKAYNVNIVYEYYDQKADVSAQAKQDATPTE